MSRLYSFNTHTVLVERKLNHQTQYILWQYVIWDITYIFSLKVLKCFISVLMTTYAINIIHKELSRPRYNINYRFFRNDPYPSAFSVFYSFPPEFKTEVVTVLAVGNIYLHTSGWSGWFWMQMLDNDSGGESGLLSPLNPELTSTRRQCDCTQILHRDWEHIFKFSPQCPVLINM